MNQTILKVFGPYEIPILKAKGSLKRIDVDNLKSFWSHDSMENIGSKQGCYVFATKAGKGHTPWYVGKTKKNFIGEAFTHHKLTKYNDLLWSGRKGTPVMFFVAQEANKRVVPLPVLNDMEKFLIQSAALKNQDILNTQNTKNLPSWGIDGVIRGGKGKTSQKNKRFKLLMGL